MKEGFLLILYVRRLWDGDRTEFDRKVGGFELELVITGSDKMGFILSDGRKMVKKYVAERPFFSEGFFREVYDTFKEVGIGVCDLSSIIVDIGPGSFTGLRITLCAVRTWKVLFPEIDIFGVSRMVVGLWKRCGIYGEEERDLVVYMPSLRDEFYGMKVLDGPEFFIKERDEIEKNESVLFLDDGVEIDDILRFYYEVILKDELKNFWIKYLSHRDILPIYVYPDDCSVRRK